MKKASIPILKYFNVRGKAETIRFLLEDNQIEYKEERHQIDQFRKTKTDYPFQQLPIYITEDDIEIPQTQAILRYLARKHDLYGKSETERIRCDVFQEALVDSRDELVKFFVDKEFHQKRESFCNKHLENRLNLLENFYNKNGGNYSVGETVTYVDYLLLSYLDYVRVFDYERLKKFKLLCEFRNRFSERKNIMEYLKSERRPKVFTLPHFQFGNTIETSEI
jgi:glutathione S-transferase